MWYSQQADEGNAPGYPMGFGKYRGIEPVRVVGNDDDGDDEDDSSSEGGPPGTVEEDGKGVPLYGCESKVILGNK